MPQAFSSSPASAEPPAKPPATAAAAGGNWQHVSMVAQRAKARRYIEVRAAAKQHQQRNVFLLGLFTTFAMGCTLNIVAVIVGSYSVNLRRGLTIAAFSCIVLGSCICLSADYDANSISRRTPWIVPLIAAQMVFISTFFIYYAVLHGDYWGMDAASVLHAAWCLLRHREISACKPGFPVPTDCVCNHGAFFFAGYCAHLAVLLCIAPSQSDAATAEYTRLAARLCVTLPTFLAVLWLAMGSETQLPFPLGCRAAHGDACQRRVTSACPLLQLPPTPTLRAAVVICVVICAHVAFVCVDMLFPEDGAAEHGASTPVLYLALVVVPMVVVWRWRAFFYGWFAKLFERRHRLQDGVFVASLLAGEPLRVGDEWWVQSEEGVGDWFPGTVSAVGSSSLTVEISAAIPREALPLGGRRTAVPSMLAHLAQVDLFRCACASLFQVPLHAITPEVLCPLRVREYMGATAAGRGGVGGGVGGDVAGRWPGLGSAALEMLRAAGAGLGGGLPGPSDGGGGGGGRGSSSSGSMDSMDGGGSGGGDGGHSSVLDVTVKACRPGEIDWFVSHSWHDDPAAKHAALQRCGREFESRMGRSPTLWLDKLCVHPWFREGSLQCLPIYIQACRGVLVLCGDSYLKRLWCVWELYTVFAFSDGEPALVIAMVESGGAHGGGGGGGGGDGGDGGACGAQQLVERMSRFSLADARCTDPNEEGLLRTAINAAPGGARAFQATIRSLTSRVQRVLVPPSPAALLGGGGGGSSSRGNHVVVPVPATAAVSTV
jgi:hypothetical protein